MGTYIYGLSAPTKLRQIQLLDGTKAKAARLEFFCRISATDVYGAYDEKDRRYRQCMVNTLERKRNAWTKVAHEIVYAVLVSGDKPEDGDTVLKLEGTLAPYREDRFQHDPVWYDCEKYPGEKVGVLRIEGRRWVIVPDEPALVTLARQAL